MFKKSLLFMLLMTLLAPWAVAQQALPYSYGFEDNDLSTDGWTTTCTNSSSGIQNDAARSGSYGFSFYYSEQNGALISPLLTGGEKGVDVSLWYKEYSNSYGDEQFYVGYTTDETVTDPDSFVYGNIVTATTSWQEYSNTFPAGTKRIAVKYVYNDAFYLFLDDFTFEPIASCPKPKDLAVTNITAESATLTWTSIETPSNGYNIRYRTGEIANPTFFDDFESNSLSGWTVYTDGTAPQSDGWYTFNPSTSGLSFDAHSGSYCASAWSWSSSSYNANNWLISPQVTFSKTLKFWVRTNAGYPDSYEVLLSTTGTDEADFTETLQAMAPAPTTGAWEEVSIDLTSYSGTGYIAIHHVSDDMNYLLIDDFGIYNDPTPAGAWVNTTSNTNSKDINGLKESTSYDFEVQANCGGETSDWVASTFTTLPSCMPVADLTISEVTTTTISLTWTDQNSGSASYIVTDGDDNPVTVTNLTITGCTVTELTANTAYTFKVTADCGSTTEIIQGRTDCNVISSIPYDEGFETETLYCWDYYGFSFLGSAYAHTGDKAIYADGSDNTNDHYVILPETAAEISSLMLNFWYYNFNSGVDCGTLYVGYFDSNDNFTNTGSIDMSSGTDEYVHSYDFDFDDAPSGSRIALYYEASGVDYAYVIIDDVTVEYKPACMRPTDLVVTNPTGHGATFAWTNNGNIGEDGWQLYISEDAAAVSGYDSPAGVIDADTNPFTVTSGLDPETTYYVWVRSHCEYQGNSPWSNPATFTTTEACPTPTGLAANNVTNHTADLSWTGSSDSYKVSYRTAAYVSSPVLNEEFNTNNLPTDWTRSSTALTDDVLNGTTTITLNNSGWNTTTYGLGQYNVKMNIYSTYKYWLITPSTTIGNGNILSFDAAITAYNSNDAPAANKMADANSRFVVLITTDNQATWTILREWNNTGSADVLNDISNTGNNFTIDLSSYKGQEVKIAFYGGQTVSGPDCDLHIDNVMIGEAVAAGTWTTKTTDASPYQLTGLLAETKYEAKVQGDCGSEGMSQETASIFFTTEVACPAPTGFAIESIGSTYVYLNWNEGSDDAWQIELTDVTHGSAPSVIDVNAMSVIVNEGVVSFQVNLTNPENDYSVRLRANCESAGEGYSEWTDPLEFTTIAACSALNPAVSNVTHHNATITWDGESDDDFTVYYREAAGIQVLFEEGFEDATEFANWTLNNCVSGTNRSTEAKHTGDYGFKFSYNSSSSGITPPQHLISPDLSAYTANDVVLSFYYTKGSSSWTETFKVGWSSTTNDPAEFTWDSEITATSAWENYSRTIPAGTKYISIAYTADDQLKFFVDDIVIGETHDPSGSQTVLAETSPANITNLTAGVKYEARVVPNCNPSLGTAWTSFNTVAGNEKYFLTAGDWATTTNWMDGEIPTITDNAIINANVSVAGTAVVNNIIFEGTSMITVESGASLTINGNVTNGGNEKIYVRDGGQLIHKNSVNATVQKGITAPSSWKGTSDTDGWYLIATPVSSTTISSTFAGTIDLFKYDEATAYWWSYNNGSHTFSYMYRGTGYLNACQYTQTVNYAGSMISTEDTWTSSTMSYTSTLTDDVRGFNLMGNPFTCNVEEGDVKLGEETNIAYLTMNDTRTDFVTVNIGDRPIKPGEGFFIQATAADQTLVFNPTSAKSSNNGYIRIVAGNENGSDNAYINLANGNTIRKFNIANGTKVYVINEGQDFAAARVEELAGSMPVHFKAVADGNYTITVNAKNLDVNTMLLFDNFTGETIDLLENPSYTFKATTNDEDNRFKLIFDCNNYTGIDENFTGDIFAYQYGNEIIVNGEGTLEVFDVMGRMVLNTKVNGVQKVNVPANAVYIFKLMGETVKTQKIVVR